MQTAHRYWSIALRAYLAEFHAGTAMLRQNDIIADPSKYGVVVAGTLDIRARIEKAIGYLGGMAGEW